MVGTMFRKFNYTRLQMKAVLDLFHTMAGDHNLLNQLAKLPTTPEPLLYRADNLADLCAPDHLRNIVVHTHKMPADLMNIVPDQDIVCATRDPRCVFEYLLSPFIAGQDFLRLDLQDPVRLNDDLGNPANAPFVCPPPPCVCVCVFFGGAGKKG